MSKFDKLTSVTCQQLDESVIEYIIFNHVDTEMLTKRDLWNKVSLKQRLTFDFMKKYKNELSVEHLITNQNIKRYYILIEFKDKRIFKIQNESFSDRW
jgi:hypothetical protein